MPTAFRTLLNPAAGDTDPYFSSVSLLLHMDGANGSTTFTDSSNNAQSVTAASTANLTTTNPKFGTAALKLNGSSDYLIVGGSTSLYAFPGDFTVEGWVNFTALPSSGGFAGLFFARGASASASAFQFYIYNNAGTYRFEITLSVGSTDYNNQCNLPSTPTAGIWYHFAFVRSGSSVYAFWNGTQAGSTVTVSGTINTPSTQIAIGARGTPFTGLYTNGKIDDFRVTKGIARYTANFTAPTAAFLDS